VSPIIIPSAEPFYIPGNRTGCLLVHGFTGTPKEMRPMGVHLNAQGYSVLGVRLFGHATRIEDMNRAHWRDWVSCVEDGWHMLRNVADQIFIMGLSMGGVLSLYFGARFPVAGIVAMASPYEIPFNDIRKLLVPAGKFLPLVMPYYTKIGEEWVNPEMEAQHINYDRNPVKAGLQAIKMMAEMRRGLPTISAPVLLMHSDMDKTVPFDHMQKIYDALGCEDKTMIPVHDSIHPITVDGDRQLVFQQAADFVKRLL
jgi:carboxylesterase